MPVFLLIFMFHLATSEIMFFVPCPTTLIVCSGCLAITKNMPKTTDDMTNADDMT
jgi:hypothetical protein